MHRADVHDHAHVGLGDRDQLGDLALAAHRHLEHQRLGSARRLEDRQRQPDLGVPVLARGVRDQARAQQRGEDVLGRGLAGRAGDREHLRAELAPPAARQRVQRGERLVHGDHRRAAAGRVADACRRPPRPPRRRARGRRSRPRRRRRAPRRRTRRRARRRRAGRRTGRPARPRASRSPRASGRRARRRRRRARRRRPRRARAADRSITRSPRPARAPAAPRAHTATSSNGSLRPSSNSWPCSWPLPAITTTSPGAADSIASAIARRRSVTRSASGAGALHDLVDDRVGLLAARVVAR